MEDNRATLARAQALMASQQWDKAAPLLEELVAKDPNTAVYAHKLADVLARLGRIKDAIARYEEVATLYVASNEPLKAIGICRVILQHDAKHTKTQDTLAKLYAHKRERPAPPSPAPVAPTKPITSPRMPAVNPPGRKTPRTLGSDGGFAILPPMAAPPEPPPEAPAPRAAPALPTPTFRTDHHEDVVDIELPLAAAPEQDDGRPRIPLFSELGKNAFVELTKQIQVIQFHEGQAIVKEGAEGSSMFCIVDGRVNVYRNDRAGEMQLVASLHDGAFFGEMALMAEVPRMATVIAATECLLMEFTQKRMRDLIKEHASVGKVLERFYRERMLSNLIRSNPLFKPLNAAQRAALSEQFKPRAIRKNAILLHQGQRSDALYLLLRGKCEVFFRTPEGQTIIYGELKEGEVFGEFSLLTGKPVTATVRTSVDATVLRLGREAAEATILANPDVKTALEALMLERQKNSAEARDNMPVMRVELM